MPVITRSQSKAKAPVAAPVPVPVPKAVLQLERKQEAKKCKEKREEEEQKKTMEAKQKARLIVKTFKKTFQPEEELYQKTLQPLLRTLREQKNAMDEHAMLMDEQLKVLHTAYVKTKEEIEKLDTVYMEARYNTFERVKNNILNKGWSAL